MTTSATPPAAEPTTILTLEGSGYTLAVYPEIEAAKAQLLEASGKIGCVNDDDESVRAQFEIRRLAGFRNLVEKSRVEVKKPLLALGNAIDAAAKDFVALVTGEESRLKLMVGNHAAEVAKAKAAAEARERRKFEEAKRAKEEAERAAAAAEAAKQAAANAVSIQDAIAAKQKQREAEAAAAAAEEERQAAQRERMASSAVVASTRVSSAVKFEPDFEVINAAEFMKAKPELCTIEVKRRETLAWLKTLDLNSEHLAANCERLGLRVTLKPVVSTR